VIFVAWCEILTFYEAVNDYFICGALSEANIQVNNRMLCFFPGSSEDFLSLFIDDNIYI